MASPARLTPVQRGILRTFGRNLGLTILIGAGSLIGILLVGRFFGFAPFSPDWNYLLAGWILLVGYLFDQTLKSAAQGWIRSLDRRARFTAVGIIVDLAVAAFLLLALLALFHVSLDTLFLGSAFTGVFLALAAQTLLSNVFGGIMLAFATPFHVGDRVSIVSASYGAFGPTYPHELMFPGYRGQVVDAGLIYTVLRLEDGQTAKIPNSVVIQALVINLSDTPVRLQRIRLTLPYAVPVARLEAAAAEVAQRFPAPQPELPKVRCAVVDLQPATWDGVIELWTSDPDPDRIRDQVLRLLWDAVPSTLPAAARAR